MSDQEKHTDRQTPTSRVWREIALTVGGIVGLICILATLAAMLFGVKPLIFRSGSMSPEITTGSLALSHNVPATELKVGDIISVENAQGTRITHRVHEIQQKSGDTVIVMLKGDANQDPDVEPYVITHADRVFTSVGGLGYAVAWLSNPAAIFLGGAFVGALLMIVVRPTIKKDDSDDDRRPGTRSPIDDAITTEFVPVIESKVEPISPTQRFSSPSARSLLAITAAAVSVFALTQATGTSAAFTDSATAKSGTLSSATKVLPAISSISASNAGAGGTQWCVMNWPHLGYGFTYYIGVYLNNTGNPVWETTRDPGVSAATGTNVTVSVGSSETEYSGSTRYFTTRIYTVNRYSGERSSDWRGQEIKRRGIFYEGTCNGYKDSISGASLEGSFGDLNARMAAPTQTTSTTAPTTVSMPPNTSTSTGTGTGTSEPATTTIPVPSPQPSIGSTTTPATTSSTTTTLSLAPTTAVTTTATDTALGTSAQSQSRDYAAALMRSPETSQTALVISNKNGDEVKRIPVSASATFEWDSSTDTLWIVDGGQLYKASGSTWSKTSVDPTSSEVPADIAALVE
ncbi:signal peptidase I [Prescottella equi]|uniref:Signal peptidase I n=1 Tax=Rhodococcus hoagii TaxID=43767 RepID=A0AAP2AT13_RHOHA|nr:signal peptidase I [Prescottella equi]MBM4625313.1 signal peptidase I [Prescottella equi]MBM4629854.1 signal peptidase I [Prescottella equi]MBM4629863.1 signal peptidase I [Prescottella equi]QPQ75226.1 signal peptidase I [Prescottella equi]SUE02681.1 S26 family peptidase [Prescottella equi]